jgi:hypothetical protein
MNLSDVFFGVSLCSGTSWSRDDYLPLEVVRLSGRAFNFGVEVHEVDRVPVKVYSPAKTVADCFKFRNKIGLDAALEALRDTWRSKKAMMDDLWETAKVCRVANVMRPYRMALGPGLAITHFIKQERFHP